MHISCDSYGSLNVGFEMSQSALSLVHSAAGDEIDFVTPGVE